MAIHRTNDFIMNGDRYRFDFKDCTYAKGWAQFDSRQDAHYFGNWVNPTTRQWASYCEGDVTLITCDTDEEFTAYVIETCNWYAERQDTRPGIDVFTMPELKARFEALGLAEWLH